MSALQTEEDLNDDSYEEYFNEDGLRVVPGYHSGPYAIITDTVTFYPGMIPGRRTSGSASACSSKTKCHAIRTTRSC